MSCEEEKGISLALALGLTIGLRRSRQTAPLTHNVMPLGPNPNE